MQVLLSDSATWVAVGVAIGAASLALVAAIVALLVVVRGRRSSYAAVEQLLRESLARTEGLHSDLAGALEEARAEAQRAVELGEIGSTIDLDAVLTLTLETAGALTRVDAALICLPAPDESEPLFATIGMSTDEAARQPVAGPPRGQPARAVRIAYTYTHEEIRDESDLIRGGVSIPLRDSEGEPIGTLAAFSRGEEREATDEEPPLSRSSPPGPGPRSRMRGAFGRPASSPTSTP